MDDMGFVGTGTPKEMEHLCVCVCGCARVRMRCVCVCGVCVTAKTMSFFLRVVFFFSTLNKTFAHKSTCKDERKESWRGKRSSCQRF